MGLLDDAIREHLELKKRSGAPEEEVRRLETEAFGPARSAAAPPAAQPEAEVTAEPEATPEPEVSAEPQTPAEPEATEPVAEPAPAPSPAPAADWLEDEPDEVPTADRLDHATSEFTAAEHAEAAGGTPPQDFVEPDEEEDADDVLEETPDFLQETPEHDRLWFEQKPPRDFDFDE
jgi:hypothetical protein